MGVIDNSILGKTSWTGSNVHSFVLIRADVVDFGPPEMHFQQAATATIVTAAGCDERLFRIGISGV